MHSIGFAHHSRNSRTDSYPSLHRQESPSFWYANDAKFESNPTEWRKGFVERVMVSVVVLIMPAKARNVDSLNFPESQCAVCSGLVNIWQRARAAGTMSRLYIRAVLTPIIRFSR